MRTHAARALRGRALGGRDRLRRTRGRPLPPPRRAADAGSGARADRRLVRPELLWLPFDATVADDDGLRWVSDRTLRAAADAAGLLCVPLLAEGPVSRLQELPVVFPTRLPGLLGLPALPDNLAEGLVVKPAGEHREPGRPMAKFKQPAFAEDERFDGSRPYQAPAQGAAGVPGWLLAHGTGLLTPARAASAVSKLGPRTHRGTWPRRSPGTPPRRSRRPWAAWTGMRTVPWSVPCTPAPCPWPASTRPTAARDAHHGSGGPPASEVRRVMAPDPGRRLPAASALCILLE
ncbi:RNA ligase family protein [Streptomyces sp. MS1.HAVA.3]|uniref:RNA ligase family protein n=1 Tax=Streptomyces caledonius TaxID=3134107 RepID=A0ABU8TXF8_9ACTN